MATGAKKNSNAVIKTLRLQSRTGQLVDLDSYLVELNIHEDMFGNAVHGTLLVSDNYNLLRDLPIEGSESLMVHIKTVNYEDDETIEIKKDFRVFNVTDRTVNFQKGNQTYILHFCSWEVFRDAFRPLYRPFDGTVSEVAVDIFDEYLMTPRYAGGPDSEMIVLDETNNPIKFISPGWTPFKCLNWLASRAISSEGKAMNYLFWESTKNFYFGSVEAIFRRLAETGEYSGNYRFLERNVPLDDFAELEEREFFAMDSMKILNVQDQLKLHTSGQLASQVLTVDLNKKDFFTTNYVHPDEYYEYTHTEGGDITPAWGGNEQGIYTQPENSVLFYPKNTRLYDDFENNINEVYHQIFGRRVANLTEINNFKLNIAITGRTDLQAGNMIYLEWPDTILRGPTGWAESGLDPRYSGFYLITAIRHKFTMFNYTCICEVVKDAFKTELASGISSAFAAGPDQSAAETARLGRL